MGKRERIDRTPGKQGGVTYVHRDAEGKFSDEQVEVGKSISEDMRVDVKHEAPKGEKDRGD